MSVSLFRTLNTSASGLRASQLGLATVSHNLANADNRSYSRQRVELGAATPSRINHRSAMLGNGTRVNAISRAYDGFFEAQVLRDRTRASFYDGRANTLNSVQRFYDDALEPSVAGSLDTFHNAARELGQDPGNNGLRRSFVQAAKNVADAFSGLSGDLQGLQRGIDDALGDRVTQVNALAATIAEANAHIVSTEIQDETSRRSANDLRDRRDEALRALSTLVDIKVIPQANGAVNGEIAGRHLLVADDQAGRLETAPDPDNDGLLGIEHIGPSPRDGEGRRVSVTAHLTEGEIGGLLDVRDRVLADQISGLDALAFEFVNALNDAHRAGFGLDGAGNRNLFVPAAGPEGAALRMAVEADILSDPQRVAAAAEANAVPGDNRVALAMADLENKAQPGIGGVTFGRRYAELVQEIGRAGQANGQQQSLHAVRRDQSEAMRESVTGVSIDDEMIELTRFQKHFEAQSRVISLVDRLMDSVLSLVR